MLHPSGSFDIRQAGPADDPALVGLEWLAPDAGRLGLRIRLRRSYLTVAHRYPNSRTFVAADRRGSLIGMISSSVAPTRCAGRVVSGVYLFSLRVHPAARRRGVGTALVRQAWEAARLDAGVEIGWAGVLDGNEASARTFARSGFARERYLLIRVVPRLTARWADARRPPCDLDVRSARDNDLDQLIAALEIGHQRHQLSRLLDADTLRHELTATGGSIHDLWLAIGQRGEIRAGGLVIDLARTADVRVAELRRLPRLVRATVEPLLRQIVIRPLLLRHALLGANTADLIRELLPAYGGSTTALSLVVDPRDPAWPSIRSLPGMTGRVAIVVRGSATLDPAVPLTPM